MTFGASAREFLANPRQRIGDIAIDLGFRNPTSFVRSFKRWYGATPGRYRRELAAGRRRAADGQRASPGRRATARHAVCYSNPQLHRPRPSTGAQRRSLVWP
ncbi:MAG: helix-turn-helix domain-containing protein [Gammaproteobacteria bacterium]